MNKLKVTGFILAGLELIISIAVIYFAMSTKMLSVTYGAIATIVLLAISVSLFLLTKVNKKKIRIMSIVFSVLFSIILGVACFFLHKTNKVVEEVTGKKVQTDEINVYVDKEDVVESINEAVEKSYKFGVIETDDKSHINETISKIEESVGAKIDTVEYDSLYSMVGAYEGGAIQSLIVSSGTILALDSSEDYQGFSQGLKIIMEHTITEEIVEEEPREIDKNHFCIYFSGIDTFGSVSSKSRSDVNIIGVVNNETKTVLLVSTPRDYLIELGGAGGKKDKLTHAGIYGIESSMGTLENLYNTQLSYYVRINFSGFQKIIDQLGGIDVNSEYGFTSITEEGTYSFSKGINHLNGEQALGFARARYAFKDGDRQRGRNQMQVIKATIEKLESPETLKNYSAIMDDLGGLFQTDMSKDDVGYLVQSTLDNGGWKVLTYSVSGSDSEEVCYSLGTTAYVMVPNKEDVSYGTELINKVLTGENLTQEEINVYIESKDQEDLITEEQYEEPTED